MDKLTCCHPTQIDFGTGKKQLIGQYLAENGIRKVLLVNGSEHIKPERMPHESPLHLWRHAPVRARDRLGR